MSKTKPSVPQDLTTLARWLALAPKPNLSELEARILGASADDYERMAEPARVALKWAWDEQPDVFFPLLKPWLTGSTDRLRQVAAGALPVAHEGWRDECQKVLKKLIVDADREVRVRAVDLMAEDPDGNLEQLKRWVKDEDPRVRQLVARHLVRVTTANVEKVLPLVEALCLDPDPDVHWTAAATLYDLHDREPRGTLDIGRRLAEHGDEDVRAAAAACFFEHVLADHFESLLPTMRSWLRTGGPELRWTLVRSLRFLRVTPRSLQLIRALFEDQDPEIRRRLVLALLDLYAAVGEQRRALCEILRRAREDASKRVRDVIDEGERRFGEGFDALVRPGESDGLGGEDEPFEGEPGDDDDDD